MCGIKSKVFLLSLAVVCFLLVPSYSESFYRISETQLQEMEQIQKDQARQIEEQKKREESLKSLQESLQTRIEDLEKSSKKSERIKKVMMVAVPVALALSFTGGVVVGIKLQN